MTVLGVTAQQNDNDGERTLDWDGQGSEHAEQNCSENEEGFWHWILTPGGSTAIETDAVLEVQFEDESSATVEGYRPSGGEQGAVHFNVTKPGGGTVESATVTFTGGGDNPVLTISDGECRPDGENGDGENGDGDGDDGKDDDEELSKKEKKKKAAKEAAEDDEKDEDC